jgi:hypothetical protein
MKTQKLQLCNQRGISVIELLLAVFITAVIMSAAFGFYVTLHGQAETQIEVSEMQNLCRASIDDMKKTLRMAGFKLSGHAPYEINGDSLLVYYNRAGTVDTMMYFLREFSDYQYSKVYGMPTGHHIWNLMKQHNSGTPEVFADYITKVAFSELSPGQIIITVSAQSAKPDQNYLPNNGFRTYSLVERVTVRNML